MKDRDIMPAFPAGAVSGELLSLLATSDTQLTICQLADRLLVSRKDALLLLLNLESQGVVTWNNSARVYRPNPGTLLKAGRP